MMGVDIFCEMDEVGIMQEWFLTITIEYILYSMLLPIYEMI